MKYETKITNIKDGKEYIHGYSLENLMREKTFAQAMYLLLRGELPSENHARMFEALLVSAIDHGPGTASAQTARITASAKNSMHASVAAGILAMGERHGSAIQGAAQFFYDHKDVKDLSVLLANLKSKKIRVPGYGHAVLEVDHRSETLFDLAKEFEVFGDHCTFAKTVHAELNKISSKTLPLNIDGAMAAILMDMGFSPNVMKGIFIIARTPGLVAQVFEEQTNDQGLRRVPESEIRYIGN